MMGYRKISPGLALGMAVVFLLAGCAPQSYVYTHGSKSRLSCVVCEKTKGADICWAVGDNSDAYSSALYAPFPGPPTRWCLGVLLSETTPRVVYVWSVPAEDQYLVYELRNVTLEYSDNFVRGHGKAYLFQANRNGKKLEGLPSPATPHETELSFVLHRVPGNCGGDEQATLNDLRTVAEKFLFKNE